MSASAIIPRPVRDLFTKPINCMEGGDVSTQGAQGMLQGAANRANRTKQKAALKHLAIAGIFAGIVLKYGASMSMPVAAFGGSLLSMPAVVIVAGGFLFFKAYSASSVALTSFSALGLFLGYLAAGYALTEVHDEMAVGILE